MAIGSEDLVAATTGTGISIGPDDGYAISNITPGPEVITISSTILSTKTITSTPSTSSSTSRAPSLSLPLGPIIGGVVAVLALIALSIFLLLKRRSSQRKPRVRAEIDPPSLMPFRFSIRERLGGYVTINDEPSSETTGLSSLPMAATSTVHSSKITPPGSNSVASPNTFSKLRGKPDARTTYALQLPIRNERIHLAVANPSPDPKSPSYLSNDFVTNDMIREERASHAPTYISNPSEPRYQTALTSISTDSGHNSDFAQPAYSFSSRFSHTNYPQTRS